MKHRVPERQSLSHFPSQKQPLRLAAPSPVFVCVASTTMLLGKEKYSNKKKKAPPLPRPSTGGTRRALNATREACLLSHLRSNGRLVSRWRGSLETASFDGSTWEVFHPPPTPPKRVSTCRSFPNSVDSGGLFTSKPSFFSFFLFSPLFGFDFFWFMLFFFSFPPPAPPHRLSSLAYPTERLPVSKVY